MRGGGGLVISRTGFGGLSIQAPWGANPAPQTHPTHPGTPLGVGVALMGRGFGVLARFVTALWSTAGSQGGFGASWGRRGSHTGQSRWNNGCGHIPQVHWGGGAAQGVSLWCVGVSVVARRLRWGLTGFYKIILRLCVQSPARARTRTGVSAFLLEGAPERDAAVGVAVRPAANEWTHAL